MYASLTATNPCANLVLFVGDVYLFTSRMDTGTKTRLKSRASVINSLEPLTRYSGISYSNLTQIDKEIVDIILSHNPSCFEQQIKTFTINSLIPNSVSKTSLPTISKSLTYPQVYRLQELADQKLLLYLHAAGVQRLSNKLTLLIALLIRRDEWLSLKELGRALRCGVTYLRPHIQAFIEAYDLQVDEASITHYYKLPFRYTEYCKEKMLYLP